MITRRQVRSRRSGLALSGALWLAAATASAQEPGWGQGSPTPGPSWGPTQPQASDPESGGPLPTESPRSVKLFDQRRTITSYQLDIGPIWQRRVEDTTPITDRQNFERGAPLASEVGFGTVSTTPKRPFFLVGHVKTLLRVLDDKSFSWAIFHQELGGGLILGPFEPEVRFRLSAITADIMHAQPSFQLLSPGVGAGVGIHLGRFRVDLRANVDYLWRWFGPDYVVRGITLGIRLDLPRPRTPFPGAQE